MVKPVHLLYVIAVLLIALAIQTYYIQRVQETALKEQLDQKFEQYNLKQKERDKSQDSLLKIIANSDFKIKEYYFTTKEKIKSDSEKLQYYPDSALSNLLNSIIEQRSRSSKFRQKESN